VCQTLTVPEFNLCVLLCCCQAQAPALASIMRVMQGRATKLLAHLDNGRSWGPAGKMPAGGQYCFEHPQVAR